MQKLSIGSSIQSKSLGKKNLFSQTYIYAMVQREIVSCCPFLEENKLIISIKGDRQISLTTDDTMTAMQLQMSKITIEDAVNLKFSLTKEEEKYIVKIKKT
jgi:hypothetical protein